MHRKRLVHWVYPVGAGYESWRRGGAAEVPCRLLRREHGSLDHAQDLLVVREAARRVLSVSERYGQVVILGDCPHRAGGRVAEVVDRGLPVHRPLGLRDLNAGFC
jgi:hypothetical protein